MSLYQGFAQQKGFGAYVVDIPDPSKKIRQQGLTALGHMKEQVAWQKEQADKVVNQFEQNAAQEEKVRAENFATKQFYAERIAGQKWRNYETSIANAKARAKRDEQDFQALLSLTKSGAKLAKMGIDHNRKMTDQFVEQLYRDYGVGRQGFLAIKNAEDKIIGDNTSLQGLLREYELQGLPMDVISRIRRSGGYMNIAVSKNEAGRFGKSIVARVGARANEKVKLPGMNMPMSLNDALATGGPTVETIYDELVRRELHDENDNPRFSNKVIALSGLGGPEGYIAKGKAVFVRKGTENLVSNEWKDRHLETTEIIKSFIGPQNGTSAVAGPKGIDAAILYFAGGEGASRAQLSASRTRVVNALDDALRNQQITWDEVKSLDNYMVKTKGAPLGQRWSKLFRKEWSQLKKAGAAYYTAKNADLELEESNLRLEGRDFHNRVKTIIQTEDPSTETLAQLLSVAKDKGQYFAPAAQTIQAELGRGLTAANDTRGTAILMARAENNEIITDEEIDAWNFSDGVKKQVRAKVRERNQFLPQAGENGTQKRLSFQIETKLTDLIKRKNAWYSNGTHKDTKIYAERKAAGHYRLAREMQGMNHEQAYNYALQEIGKDIGSPQSPPRDPYYEVITKRGVKSFKGALPKPMPRIEIDPVEIGKELHTNPGLIYSKDYFDASEIAEMANQGVYKSIHPTALAIQSLTRGRINAVDAMQAQLQLQRDEETKEFGAPKTPLLPDAYIKRYKTESNKIGPLAQALLGSYNVVDVSKAYVSSGYQPPNQDSYYSKVNKIIETGDPNNIVTPEGKSGKSLNVLKYNVTDRTIGEVLKLMGNGHILNAGNAQFDSARLTEAVTLSGIGMGSKFSWSNQKKLQNVLFKKHGLKAFPHIEQDEYNLAIGDNVHQAVNNEKITPDYFRSYASCSDDACKFMRENPHLFPHLGGTKQ